MKTENETLTPKEEKAFNELINRIRYKYGLKVHPDIYFKIRKRIVEVRKEKIIAANC